MLKHTNNVIFNNIFLIPCSNHDFLILTNMTSADMCRLEQCFSNCGMRITSGTPATVLW
jgi:hypothetical protein